MAEEKAKASILTSATLVPLGAACLAVTAIIGSAVATYAWMDEQFDGLRADVKEIKTTVNGMEQFTKTGWTKTQMRTFAQLLAAQNPGLNVPNVEE